ncbi:PaaX family transcriptional regulator [Bradyrhizobium sp. BRP14]|nr:PaaX family transcriptional regulator [Bradyrhizobium sp. BRP14]
MSTADGHLQTLDQHLGHLLKDFPVKAASFIVTLYGDVIEPRGGTVWIGNLIETCREVGITETLVRTAISRLVAAGQVSGAREGRRSYYRLTPVAQAEFAKAAGVLYGPQVPAKWQFVLVSGPAADETMQILERDGFARVGPRLVVGTHQAPRKLPGRTAVFDADVSVDNGGLKEFAGEAWNLPLVADKYREFSSRFGKFAAQVGDCTALSSTVCLVARLLLVHQYRLIMLKEPRLPQAALPLEWPGEEARKLFAQLYLRLSTKADPHIARRFKSDTGPLPQITPEIDQRLTFLQTI